MLITDAQVHIWRANSPERPWRAGEKSHREPPLEADELLHEMDAAGVNRAILVPPFLDGDRNDLVLEAARLHPDRFAVMGRPDGKTTSIEKWREQPGMLGLRFSSGHLIAGLTEGSLDWLWKGAEKAGVPFMILLPHAKMHLIDHVAERYPGLKLVMSHLGVMGTMRGEEGFRDLEAFRELDKLLVMAKRPNVAVKASALPCFTSDDYPYRSLHPYLHRVYDAFGTKRMFWGTDLARLPCSYRQAVTMFTEEIPWFTTEDKEWIMGRGLCEWLGWKLPAV